MMENQTFDKRNLDTGMVVETYNGEKYVVVKTKGYMGGGILDNPDGFLCLEDYNADMTMDNDVDFDIDYDIKRVYVIPEYRDNSQYLLMGKHRWRLIEQSTELIWERVPQY
jgi:hypothetical protein